MKKDNLSDTKALRQKAEELFKNKGLKVKTTLSKADVLRHFHELEVHQIELEMQNEELIRAKELAQIATQNYEELYDFSPMGYYTIANNGEILSLNLAGAQILGKERDKINGRLFHLYLTTNSIPIFKSFLVKVFSSKVQETCELQLLTIDNIPLYIFLTGFVKGNGENCYATAVDISIRRRAEEALRKSEVLQRKMVSNIGDVIAIIDQNGINRYKSSNITQLFGWESEELIGKSAWEVIHPEDIKNVQELFGKLLENPFPTLTTEIRYRCKDGKYVWIEVKMINLLSDPDILGFLANYHDITNRKLEEEKLRISEEKYHTIFKTLLDAYYEAGLDGKIIDISPSIEIITKGQYTRDELIGKSLDTFYFNSADRDTFSTELYKYGKVTDYELILKNKDGSAVPVSISCSLIYDNESKPVKIAGSLRDITARKLAEEEIKIQHDRLHAIISAMPDLIFVIDKEGTYTEFFYANPQLLPIPEVDIIGTKLTDFFELETANDYLKHINECIRDQKLITYEYEISEENRIKYYEARVAPYGKDKILSVVRDITDKKEKEFVVKKLSIAVSQSPISIVITDIKGDIEYVNPAFEQATGYKFEEVIGKNPRILKSGRTDETKYLDLWKTITAGKEWHGEWINKKKDGEFYWEDVVITPVYGDNGKIINYLAVKHDITHRKQSEMKILELNETLEKKVVERTIQLDEALNTLHKIANRVPGVVYQFQLRPDGSSCFPYASEGILDIYGLTPEVVIEDASSVFAAIYPDDLDGVIESIQTSANNLELWRHEYRVKFKDGTIRWLAGNAMPQREADGSVLWHGFISDITERRQIALELAIEKQSIDLIIEGNKLGTWQWNVQTGETIFNEQWANLIGYTLEEISPINIETWRHLTHPDDLKISESLLDIHFKGKSDSYSFETRLKHKNGAWVWILDRGKVHTWDQDGKPLLMSGTHLDISTLKDTEKELSIKKQRLVSILEGTNVGTWEWNIQTGETIFNDRWANIIGYTLDEISPTSIETWMKFAHPDDLRISGELLKKHFIGETDYYTFESRMQHKDGDWVWVLDRGKVHEWDAYGKPLLMSGTHQDITESKKAEEELRKTKHEAEKANHAKSEFLSRMSHELRTPLNSILGFAQIMEMGELNPKQKKGVNHILKSGRHLLDLINEVLDISSIEAGRITLSPELVQLSKIISEILEIVSPQADKHQIVLRFENSNAERLFIRSDRQRLRQVLLNLINNAIKYNKAGGSVVIKTELRPGSILGLIRISITDTGFGISHEDIPKLFIPFERLGAVKTKTEGTGLGLSVVKRLMEAMGGNLGVDSTPGVGSTFWIELPLCEMPPNHVEKPIITDAKNSTLANTPSTILYIEDNVSNIELIEQILSYQHSDIRLITTMYGSQAVDLAIEYSPELILLDLNLPDIHGSKVLELLLAEIRTRDIPIVVISADAMPHQREMMLNAGAGNYLTKPIDAVSFLRVVDDLISKPVGSSSILPDRCH